MFKFLKNGRSSHMDKKSERHEISKRMLLDNMALGLPMSILTAGPGIIYLFVTIFSDGDPRKIRSCLFLSIGSLIMLCASIWYRKHPDARLTPGWVAFSIYIFFCTYYGMSRSLFSYRTGGNYMIDFIVIVIWCFGIFEIYPAASISYGAVVFYAMYYLMHLVGITDYSLTSWTMLFLVFTFLSVLRYHLAIRNIYDSLEIEFRNRQLEYLSSRDGLTGLFNRFCLREKFDEYIGRSVIVAMMDIDDFKHYNDNYGHDFGDFILKLYGKTAKRVFTGADIFRYGGDEILIVSETDFAAFEKEVHIFTADITRGFSNVKGRQSTPTFSLGFVSGTPEKATDLRAMLKQADENLYDVKHAQKHSYKGSTMHA